MFATSRVVHYKTAGLRPGEIINGEFSNQQFLLQIEKKPRRSGQGVWRGVNEIFGMRDGWHTIPVKLLSQLWLSFGLPYSTIPRWVFPDNRNRLRLQVLDRGTARTGQFKSVDPQCEQRIEGHKLGFVRVLARLGRTTSYQQWRLNGLRVCDTRMSCICTNSTCSAGDIYRKYLLH